MRRPLAFLNRRQSFTKNSFPPYCPLPATNLVGAPNDLTWLTWSWNGTGRTSRASNRDLEQWSLRALLRRQSKSSNFVNSPNEIHQAAKSGQITCSSQISLMTNKSKDHHFRLHRQMVSRYFEIFGFQWVLFAYAGFHSIVSGAQPRLERGAYSSRHLFDCSPKSRLSSSI